jgi:DNA-binding NarL/FixJ family response regulator
MIRLFIIEDHSLIVEGLRNRFRPSRDGIEIIGSAENVQQTVLKLKISEFDIFILDLWIPGSDPLENVKELNDKFPDKAIIILTYEDSPFWKQQMFDAGVKAYLTKNVDKGKLKKTIEQVFSGKVILQEPYQLEIYKVMNTDQLQKKYHLKPSEKQIAIWISSGMLQKEIAAKRGMTVWAIEKTLKKLRKQFNVRTNFELIHVLTMLKEI